MLTSLTLAYVAHDRAGDSLFEEETPAPPKDAAFGEAPAAPADAMGAFEEVPAPAAEPGARPRAEAVAPQGGSVILRRSSAAVAELADAPA